MRAPMIRASLVTLAACDSALGLSAGGEGLLGLTRGFQFAGVDSVLATLWRVSDSATQPLMIGFYTELAAGQPLDLALARAQRRLIHSAPSLWDRWTGNAMDYGHPYFWSGFALVGSPN
jgi:CHAT domain-containing protein